MSDNDDACLECGQKVGNMSNPGMLLLRLFGSCCQRSMKAEIPG